MSKKDRDCNTTTYHAHDRALKQIFSNKIMMQYLIKDFIKGKWAEQFDFNTMKRVNVKHVTNDLRERENDVIWKIQFKNQPVYVITMIEFQSNIEHYMALRIMVYTGLLLQDIIKQGDPFLIEDKYLPPVFPIVFYTGKSEWNAPFELKKCFNPELPRELLEFQPEIKYLLLDIGHLKLDQYTFESDDILLPLIELRRLDNYKDLKPTFYKLLLRLQDPRLDGVKKDIFRYLKYAMNMPNRFPNIKWDEIEGGNVMLSERMDQWEKDFYQDGYEKGIEKGIEKGVYEQQKSFLIRLLETQTGSISLKTRKRIDNLSSLELDRWINKMLNVFAGKISEKT